MKVCNFILIGFKATSTSRFFVHHYVKSHEHSFVVPGRQFVKKFGDKHFYERFLLKWRFIKSIPGANPTTSLFTIVGLAPGFDSWCETHCAKTVVFIGIRKVSQLRQTGAARG
jgi:hypothetical protein